MAKVKEDCFGINPRTNMCKVLKITVCEKEDCPFYKTRRQYEKEMGDKK